MSILLVVSVLILFAVGYAIGTILEMARADSRLIGYVKRWNSMASTLQAEAKELEQEHRLGDQHDCLVRQGVFQQCAKELYQDYLKEPRRII